MTVLLPPNVKVHLALGYIDMRMCQEWTLTHERSGKGVWEC